MVVLLSTYYCCWIIIFFSFFEKINFQNFQKFIFSISYLSIFTLSLPGLFGVEQIIRRSYPFALCFLQIRAWVDCTALLIFCFAKKAPLFFCRGSAFGGAKKTLCGEAKKEKNIPFSIWSFTNLKKNMKWFKIWF